MAKPERTSAVSRTAPRDADCSNGGSVFIIRFFHSADGTKYLRWKLRAKPRGRADLSDYRVNYPDFTQDRKVLPSVKRRILRPPGRISLLVSYCSHERGQL
jgi:hypothetical protein